MILGAGAHFRREKVDCGLSSLSPWRLYIGTGDQLVWQQRVHTRKRPHQALCGGPRPSAPVTPSPTPDYGHQCMRALAGGLSAGEIIKPWTQAQVLVPSVQQPVLTSSLDTDVSLSLTIKPATCVHTGRGGPGRWRDVAARAAITARCAQPLSSLVGHCVGSGFKFCIALNICVALGK